MRRWKRAAAGYVLWLGVLTACGVERTAGPTGWNVLLVSVDTLRADHLSIYGGDVPTPHIDSLAEDGVLYEHASTVAPTTLPAHASLFTSLLPFRHGVRDNVGFYLSQSHRTLASHLKSHGYQTAAFVGSFVMDARFGLSQGFDVYDDDVEVMNGPLGYVAERRGDRVLDRALEWLGSETLDDDGQPFFAFLHFYDPHTPYDPPEPFASGDYAGEVRFVDALVGRLLEWLESRELEDETLVVLTADHGESLGEHGELTHGFFVYQSTLHVPLIVRYPGAPAGSRIAAPARLVDVAPTVLDHLGLPPLAGDGTSLHASTDDGETPDYAEAFVPRLHYGFRELRSLRRGKHKLILAPEPELYDLDADPEEANNLALVRPELARELRDRIETLIGADEEIVPEAVDAETRARLASLGYVGDFVRTESDALPDPKSRIDVYRALNDPGLQSAARGAELIAALDRVEQVLRREPNIPRAHLLHGELLLKSDRAAEAERSFSELIELRRDSYEGHLGLGVACFRQGKSEEALDAFERALAIEPRNTKAYFHVAELEAARGHWEAAESSLRRAVELSPERLLVERLVEVLLRAGKVTAARPLLAKLGEERIDDPMAQYNVGQLFLLAGETAPALEALRRAASLAPDDPEIHQALANALAGAGELEGAVSEYQRAVAVSPCFATAHANLGSAYAELGRLSDAVASYERAVSCEPNYAMAYKNLAAVQLELGNLPAALDAMESAVRSSPEDSELRQALAELKAYAR